MTNTPNRRWCDWCNDWYPLDHFDAQGNCTATLNTSALDERVAAIEARLAILDARTPSARCRHGELHDEQCILELGHPGPHRRTTIQP